MAGSVANRGGYKLPPKAGTAHPTRPGTSAANPALAASLLVPWIEVDRRKPAPADVAAGTPSHLHAAASNIEDGLAETAQVGLEHRAAETIEEGAYLLAASEAELSPGTPACRI